MIDILIESEHYWELVSDETVRCDSGPTVVPRTFGWLLSGPLRDSVTANSVSSNFQEILLSLLTEKKNR